MKHVTQTLMLPASDRELIKFALMQLEARPDAQTDTKVNAARLRELIANSDIDIHKAPEHRK